MIVPDSPSNLNNIRGRWKGRPAFVAATGPSLRHVDPSALAGRVVIACNLAILKFPRAQVFFHTDSAIPAYAFWRDLDSMPCEVPLNWHFREECYTDPLPIRHWWYDRKWDSDQRGQWRLDPADTKLIAGQESCVPVAVHLAVVAGCSPIVLLGVDCCYENGLRYFNEVEGWQDEGLKAYRVARGHDPMTPHVPADRFTQYVQWDWEMLRRYNPDVPIVNASGGIMEHFPRMTLADALVRYPEPS